MGSKSAIQNRNRQTKEQKQADKQIQSVSETDE
jgi:hypothetical protein